MTDDDLLARIKAACLAPFPHEPIKATREQLDLLTPILPKASARQPWEPDPTFLTGVPVHIVEDVEESTPWIRTWAEQRDP